MKKNTILIAESHIEQAEFIKKALIKNNVEISIIDATINNGEEMKNAIIDLKPDLVLTNEVKSDTPATDIIREIQSNINEHQPIFIICSGYSENDIELLCSQKRIWAYSVSKPIDYNDLAIEIENIVNGSASKLKKHLYFNFSKINLETAIRFIEDNSTSYIFDPGYAEISQKLSKINEELNKYPKKVRDKFIEFKRLEDMNSMYEYSFIYQFFHSRINK